MVHDIVGKEDGGGGERFEDVLQKFVASSGVKRKHTGDLRHAIA